MPKTRKAISIQTPGNAILKKIWYSSELLTLKLQWTYQCLVSMATKHGKTLTFACSDAILRLPDDNILDIFAILEWNTNILPDICKRLCVCNIKHLKLKFVCMAVTMETKSITHVHFFQPAPMV